jgi:hypothetical protein|tara:strand:+ start:71 stop:586 length:516 start_codon:yes stop_codon:yes gene_type:complete
MNQPTDLSANEEYEYLLQDLQAIAVEASFIAREVLSKAKHDIGRTVLDSGLYQRGIRTADGEPSMVATLAQDMQIGKRDLYDCLKFAREAQLVGGYQAFLDQHNLGKNLSWSGIKKLLGPAEPEEGVESGNRQANRADRKKAVLYARRCIGRVFTERDLEYIVNVLAIKLP